MPRTFRPMIRPFAILALLCSSAPALAQAAPAASDAKMVQLVQSVADEGAKLVGEIKTGKLADGDLWVFEGRDEQGTVTVKDWRIQKR